MSSVQDSNGVWWKRCMRCGEWTDYDSLLYVPPTRTWDRAEDERLHALTSTDPHPSVEGARIMRDDEAARNYATYNGECFGLDVCAACGVSDARREPFITIQVVE